MIQNKVRLLEDILFVMVSVSLIYQTESDMIIRLISSCIFILGTLLFPSFFDMLYICVSYGTLLKMLLIKLFNMTLMLIITVGVIIGGILPDLYIYPISVVICGEIISSAVIRRYDSLYDIHQDELWRLFIVSFTTIIIAITGVYIVLISPLPTLNFDDIFIIQIILSTYIFISFAWNMKIVNE